MKEEIEVPWQTRDMMKFPTNPLQRIAETFAFASDDLGADKRMAFLYAIVLGWDDASYRELQPKHNWSDEDVVMMKNWHKEYCRAWVKYMEDKI